MLRVKRLLGDILRFFSGALNLLPNIYYGNTAGFFNNYLAKSELKKFRSCSNFGSLEFSKEERSLSKNILENGFALLGNDKETKENVKKLQSFIKNCFEKNVNCFQSSNGATLYILDAEKNKEIRGLLSDKLKNIILDYYQTGFYIKTARIWRNKHVENIDGTKTDVYSNTFHHDNTYVSGLRVFVYLNDSVNRDTGALKFHDLASSKKFVRSLKFFQRFLLSKSVIEELNSADSLKYFEGDAGDVAVVNVQECLHSASVPKFGSYRDVLQFEIYPSAEVELDNDKIFNKIPKDFLLQGLMS